MSNKCGLNEKMYMLFDGELNEREKEEVLQHVNACEFCKEEFAIIEQMLKGMKEIKDVDLPEGYEERLHERLVNSTKKAKVINFADYKKPMSVILSVAATLILTVVCIRGYSVYDSWIGMKNTNLAGEAGAAMMSIDSQNRSKQENPDNYINEFSGAKIAEDGKQSYKNKSVAREADSVANSAISSDNLTKDIPHEAQGDRMLTKQAPPVKGSSAGEVPMESAEDSKVGTILQMQNLETKQSATAKIAFEIILNGTQSTVKEKQNLIIKNQAQLDETWSSLRQNVIAPKIDFEKYLVIAVFTGERPTSGYKIMVAGVFENTNNIQVKTQEEKPTLDMITLSVITSPYELIKIPKSEKEIIFQSIE